MGFSPKKAVKKIKNSISKSVSKIAGGTVGKIGGGLAEDLLPTVANVFVPGLGTLYSVTQLAQGRAGGIPVDKELTNIGGVTQVARVLGKGAEGGFGNMGHEAEKQYVQNQYESTALGGYKQQTQDQMKEMQRRLTQTQNAVAYAQEMANKQATINSKMGMLAEQESERAGRPINKSYLGSSTTGAYIDEEQIKEKKRLGGKLSSTGAKG